MADWDPDRYRRWFETPLGKMADADEKAVVFELAGLKTGEAVLDIGCGEGNFTVPAAERTGRAVGIDPSEAMLRGALRRTTLQSRIAYVQGLGENLPFADGSFDVVLMVTVLCFDGNPDLLIKEAYRVRRPGGRLIVGELGTYSVWALIRRMRGIFGDPIWSQSRFYSPGRLRTLLQRARFEKAVLRGAVFYPPIHGSSLLQAIRPIEKLGRRFCPWAGAFLAVRGIKSAGNSA